MATLKETEQLTQRLDEAKSGRGNRSKSTSRQSESSESKTAAGS